MHSAAIQSPSLRQPEIDQSELSEAESEKSIKHSKLKTPQLVESHDSWQSEISEAESDEPIRQSQVTTREPMESHDDSWQSGLSDEESEDPVVYSHHKTAALPLANTGSSTTTKRAPSSSVRYSPTRGPTATHTDSWQSELSEEESESEDPVVYSYHKTPSLPMEKVGSSSASQKRMPSSPVHYSPTRGPTATHTETYEEEDSIATSDFSNDELTLVTPSQTLTQSTLHNTNKSFAATPMKTPQQQQLGNAPQTMQRGLSDAPSSLATPPQAADRTPLVQDPIIGGNLDTSMDWSPMVTPQPVAHPKTINVPDHHTSTTSSTRALAQSTPRDAGTPSTYPVPGSPPPEDTSDDWSPVATPAAADRSETGLDSSFGSSPLSLPDNMLQDDEPYQQQEEPLKPGVCTINE